MLEAAEVENGQWVEFVGKLEKARAALEAEVLSLKASRVINAATIGEARAALEAEVLSSDVASSEELWHFLVRLVSTRGSTSE